MADLGARGAGDLVERDGATDRGRRRALRERDLGAERERLDLAGRPGDERDRPAGADRGTPGDQGLDGVRDGVGGCARRAHERAPEAPALAAAATAADRRRDRGGQGVGVDLRVGPRVDQGGAARGHRRVVDCGEHRHVDVVDRDRHADSGGRCRVGAADELRGDRHAARVGVDVGVVGRRDPQRAGGLDARGIRDRGRDGLADRVDRHRARPGQRSPTAPAIVSASIVDVDTASTTSVPSATTVERSIAAVTPAVIVVDGDGQPDRDALEAPCAQHERDARSRRRRR